MKRFILKAMRKIMRDKQFGFYDFLRAEYSNEKGNDLIYETLKKKCPCMMAKFGTFELGNLVCYKLNEEGITLNDYWDFVRGRNNLFPKDTLKGLCSNAGFFSPNLLEDGHKLYDLTLDDMQQIDILASYLKHEDYFKEFLHCKTVNLDAFYAPFMWEKPWTRVLKGKKILVVHPFVESIRKQYETNRTRLFSNPDVLPEFADLITVKAVQSIAGNKVPYHDWFEALEAMEHEIAGKDFDIALIGCGAYGMNLAAFVKRMGKQAVHLAGWTQMLFGVYGSRWLNDQPQYSRFINEYWIRPDESERPSGAEKIENGCYW